MPWNLGDNVIIENGVARIGNSDVRRLTRHRLRVGDIVLSRRGDVGRRSIVRAENADWLCGTGCLAVRFGRELRNVNPSFVAYYIGTHAAQAWLVDNAVGGTMLNLNTRILGSLPILLSDRLAQDRAVAALDAAVARDNSLVRLVAKKRAIKQGMMQELLTGRARLSGFSSSWEIKTFGDIAAPVRDKTIPANSSGRVIELEHIEQGTGRLLGDADVRGSISLKTRFAKGDVLFGKLRAYLRKYWFADRDGYCSTEIWALRAHRGAAVGEYVRYVVEQDGFIAAASTAHGTHMPRSDWSVVSRWELAVPSIDEQRAIARVLGDSDAEIEALERRLEATRAIKQGMMQELLTGRTRLSVEGEAA